MPQTGIHQCPCPYCQSDTPHPEQTLHHQMHALLSRLDEQQRRWYAALESSRLGYGGDQQIARITGLNVQTTRRRRQELSHDLSERPANRVRTPGAGCPRDEKNALIEQALLDLVEPETAGAPMGEQKWLRSSLGALRERLAQAIHQVSAPVVSRLLHRYHYALRVNAKKKEAGSQHPERDAQFRYIKNQKQAFMAAGDPIIIVDTKNKELIGDFKNAGQAWKQEAEAVRVHDVLSEALGRGVPYGIYDVQQNDDVVSVGQSADTAECAVEAIKRWWHAHGQKTYPRSTKLLILADENSYSRWSAPSTSASEPRVRAFHARGSSVMYPLSSAPLRSFTPNVGERG